MADEKTEGAPGEAGEDGAAPRKKFSMKLIVMVVGGLLVVGGAAGGYFMFFGKKHQDDKPVAAPVKPPAFFDMPEVLVNLANAGADRTHYLRAKIVLEVADQAVVEQIKPVMPRVLDAFQTYLREMRPTDLEGSAGLYRVRDELTRRVNVAVSPNRINAVLFKEIVVQ
jgi:flagellar protein FliL